ncbi:hypothetical protein KKH65_03090 [bacterium]|nr:hypothetical protein [bacterium]MBU2461845.1 hypothetical protein [bacterium]
MGKYKEGNEAEIYGLLGVSLGNTEKTFLIFTLGCSGQDMVDLERSNATGWTYLISVKRKKDISLILDN